MGNIKVIIKKVNSELIINQWAELVEGLYEQRKEAVERLKNKKAACVSIMAGYLLIEAVKEAYGMNKDDIRVLKTEFGKPYLENCSDFKYNISHSGDYVAIAYGKEDVGIDIEQIREMDLKVANRFFHNDEIEYITRTNKEQNKRFFEIWTGKEAYLKYTGQGINVPLDSVVVNIEEKKIQNLDIGIAVKQVDDLLVTVCALDVTDIDYKIDVYDTK